MPRDDDIPDLLPLGSVSEGTVRGPLAPPENPRPASPQLRPTPNPLSRFETGRTTQIGGSGLELGVSDEELFSGSSSTGREPEASFDDEHEFDPLSRRQQAPQAQQAPRARKAPTKPVDDELEFDPLSRRPPAPQALQASTKTVAPVLEAVGHAATLVGGPGVGLGSEASDAGLELEPANEPAAHRSSAPPPSKAPRSLSLGEPAALGPDEVPALEVPSLSPTPKIQAAPRPQVAAARAAFPPTDASPLNLPGVAGEVDLGDDLDDLDFGGAAAAQLNVAFPTAVKDEDVPWPTGVTPYPEDLAVSHEEAQKFSGFGPAPNSVGGAPMYALRVFLALRDLHEKDQLAERRLKELERARDERLAALAERKRSDLADVNRFASLYSGVGRHDENIEQKRGALAVADVEGAEALRQVWADIEAMQVERQVKREERDAQGLVLAKAEESVRRAMATLKRVQIKWRNVERRAQKIPGKVMPDDLNAELDQLEVQRVAAKKELDLAKEERKTIAALFESAEDQLRLRSAELQYKEAQKEGLLMAYEGDIAVHSRELDQALAEKQHELAEAGRVILDLRGEVPVDVELRRELLAADQAVKVAATQREISRLALASMDDEGYGTGKLIWLVGFLAVVALLLFSIL